MKLVWIVLCTLLVWSCSEPSDNEEQLNEDTTEETASNDASKEPVNKEELVEVVGVTYTEYYDAAKTKIKFQGEQDENKQRHGKWVHYFENGQEASVTFYTNGIRNGFSSVRRPNGAMYYHGEYKDDKPVGIWKYYNESGKFSHEQDYDKK